MSEPNWNGYCLRKEYLEFKQAIENVGFQFLDRGSFREVYDRGNVVIKIPQNTDGLLDNHVEARAYRKYRNGPTREGIYVVPCRLLPNGCLMMPKVERYVPDSLWPKWAEIIDGAQIGMHKGRVVAYDCALDLVERFEWEREWNRYSEFFNSHNWREQSVHIYNYLQNQVELDKAG